MHQKLHVPVCATTAVALMGPTGLASTIDLSGPADPTSRISEFDLTGAFAQIDFGDGTLGDADGAYSLVDESGPFGSALDVFPNESDFGVGSLTFDESGVTGLGTEAAPVTALDLGELWTTGSPASDISGVFLSFFFFTAPVDIVFGGLDAADVVTLVDGVPTSIDLTIDASFVVDLSGAGQSTSFDGTFSISGDRYALTIDETEFDVVTTFGVLPRSRVVFDINGTIASVPGPGVAGVLGIALLGITRSRRRH